MEENGVIEIVMIPENTGCYNTGVINSLNDVVIDQMHQPWRTFAALINRSLSGKTSALDKLRLSRAQILWGMYHQKNVDYVKLLWEDFNYQIDNKVYKNQDKIFVSRKESSQIYGAVLPECLTIPEMKESKAYKTYLGYAIGVVPPKIARKFKKASPSKKDSIVIRETPVKTKSKGKEKVNVDHGKGIELLSEVVLAEKAQLKEIRKKSMRDFHRIHPSGSGIIAEKPPRVEKIKPIVTNEGTGDKLGVPDVTRDDSTESESESWGNDEDDNNDESDAKNESNDEENESDDEETQSYNEKGLGSEEDTDESGSESEQHENKEDVKEDDEVEDELVHFPFGSNDEDDDNMETKNDEKMEGDEDKGMDDTTTQFDDDVYEGLNEPIHPTGEGALTEGVDAEMVDAQQGNENLVITQEQVTKDAHVTISTVAKETEAPVPSTSHSSNLASKFLNFFRYSSS
ncbi:hypothetical protein Tco_1108514 [Tanacetum coccineum]